MGRASLNVLVLGRTAQRASVAAAIETTGANVVDCDPALGDCVMYVRLEEMRYDAFVFADYRDPVTRGALAVAPQRSIVIPLFDSAREVDLAHEGYLFRLPRALAVRDEREREAVLGAFPGAGDVAIEIVGPSLADSRAWLRLLAHVTSGTWPWTDLVDRVAQEIRHAQ